MDISTYKGTVWMGLGGDGKKCGDDRLLYLGKYLLYDGLNYMLMKYTKQYVQFREDRNGKAFNIKRFDFSKKN